MNPENTESPATELPADDSADSLLAIRAKSILTLAGEGPARAASCFSASSSSRETLSENSITLRLFCSA